MSIITHRYKFHNTFLFTFQILGEFTKRTAKTLFFLYNQSICFIFSFNGEFPVIRLKTVLK